MLALMIMGVLFFISCIIISIAYCFKKDKNINNTEKKIILLLNLILIGVGIVGLTIFIVLMTY